MNLKNFFVIIIIALILKSCDYRTPSKIRFEKITSINLPNSITVIQDRFEESGPDYGLIYEISLNKIECYKILEKIKNSEDWINSNNKWKFDKTTDGIIYQIIFLENECQINYIEEIQ